MSRLNSLPQDRVPAGHISTIYSSGALLMLTETQSILLGLRTGIPKSVFDRSSLIYVSTMLQKIQNLNGENREDEKCLQR
jgi:hypothetical protein